MHRSILAAVLAFVCPIPTPCAPTSKKAGAVKEGSKPRLRMTCGANEATFDRAAIGIQGRGYGGPVAEVDTSGSVKWGAEIG